MTSAIIVASGSSRRMGFDKLTATLDGKPVLQRTIEAFVAADEIDSIIVVCPADRWHQLNNLPDVKPITRVDGGEARQDSVLAGLNALPADADWVAVHDGARPLVSATDIDHCINAAREHGAATLARPATETMKRSDQQGFCTEPVSREQLWCMETPQVFNKEQLRLAYLEVTAKAITCTDEVSAVQTIGGRVKFIEPSRPNPKVTTPADLTLAAALLKQFS